MARGRHDRFSPAVTVAVIALLLFGGGATAALYLARLGAERDPPKPVPGKEAAPAREGAEPKLDAPALGSDLHIGGRSVAWWTRRLNELKSRGDPRVYDLTRRRAEDAGLVVREQGGAIEASPGSDLLRQAFEKEEP